jgi:hypothetical protein
MFGSDGSCDKRLNNDRGALQALNQSLRACRVRQIFGLQFRPVMAPRPCSRFDDEAPRIRIAMRFSDPSAQK